MNLTQKIYFNDKLLVLTSNKDLFVREHPFADRYDVFAGGSVSAINLAVHQLEKPESDGVIIENDSMDVLFAHLQSMFHPLDAAGGVTFNEKGEILMIYRRGKWDLPKGKLDEGEKIDECALREVAEETGLRNISLAGKICDTYHIYVQNSERLLKRTAWYKMKGSSGDRLKPQKEENILEARWVDEKDLAPLAARTYEAVREVLKEAGLKW